MVCSSQENAKGDDTMQHPYLYFSAADEARFREKIRTDPAARARYDAIDDGYVAARVDRRIALRVREARVGNH